MNLISTNPVARVCLIQHISSHLNTVPMACEVDNGGCNQTCVTSNTSSDAYCVCEEGYVLDSDGRQCIGKGLGGEVCKGSEMKVGDGAFEQDSLHAYLRTVRACDDTQL